MPAACRFPRRYCSPFDAIPYIKPRDAVHYWVGIGDSLGGKAAPREERAFKYRVEEMKELRKEIREATADGRATARHIPLADAAIYSALLFQKGVRGRLLFADRHPLDWPSDNRPLCSRRVQGVGTMAHERPVYL
jgi:hypothetical protein